MEGKIIEFKPKEHNDSEVEKSEDTPSDNVVPEEVLKKKAEDAEAANLLKRKIAWLNKQAEKLDF